MEDKATNAQVLDILGKTGMNSHSYDTISKFFAKFAP